MDVLKNMFSSTGTTVTNRMDLTYHKLRQMWVSQMIAKLDTMIVQNREDGENGEHDYWND